MNLIEEKVLQTIKKYSMINAGDKVLLALSGGYDSTALCLILNNLVDILKIKLAVAHLNHSIRGKEADEDEKFVIALANQLNIPVITKKIDIPALKAQSKKFSLEELARTERYKFLKETAQKLKVSKIATGHTANDQIENFFLSALSGRGTTALAGIPPVTQNIIRPLIECTKDEILQYLKEQGIEARLDSSNLDVKIPRNWIRHKLIPFIQHNFKPFKTSILQTINILHCEDLFLEKIVDALFEDVKY
ncbi:MAG: tRNA lysidine(34) synthetase TilS, partial [Candidatus Altiarchaeales archaeon]